MNKKLTKYTCKITLVFEGNGYEAESEKDYKDKVKDNFFEEFGINLIDKDISNIEESQ